MMSFFTYEQTSILIRLLIAHCITDFLLQPDYWIAEKRRKIWASKYLLYHGLLTGIVGWLLVPQLNIWWVILTIIITHTILDGCKLSLEKKYGSRLSFFLVDQLLHVVI